MQPQRELHFKDEGLRRLADAHNVAQFVSFDSGGSQRFACVAELPMDHPFRSIEESARAILQRSVSRSVNVRTFVPGDPKGHPFHYGLSHVEDVVGIVNSATSDGLFVIINETIDVNDGGVSGVTVGGVTEFAPGDTPRCVEKPGTAAFEAQSALQLLRIVYGFEPDLHFPLTERVEFSVHPVRVGFRQAQTIIWEIENIGTTQPDVRLSWPNRFSRFIGDKVFGLLVAHLAGAPVPRTTVIGRDIAPFSFGDDTGLSETWIRTAPRVATPGHFTTQRGWLDPFVLLQTEDPTGTKLASVLAQQGVSADFSGAAGESDDGPSLIEGVAGFGDDFMLGRRSPVTLPDYVMDAVQALVAEISSRVGHVRMEWAHDGKRAWVLQLHQARELYRHGVIFPGTPRAWRSFDPERGLDALVDLIAEVRLTGEGVSVNGDVGVTSHIGDLLRKARIPSRVRATPTPVQMRLR